LVKGGLDLSRRSNIGSCRSLPYCLYIYCLLSILIKLFFKGIF